jgi:Gpi18-like mannosyltransferase
MQSPGTEHISTSADQANGTALDNPVVSTSPSKPDKRSLVQDAWMQWYGALKGSFPVYFAIHLAFFVISCLSVLFTLGDFSRQAMPIYTLWQSWHRWDTGHYLSIAQRGYDVPYRTAFFPLYPLLERAVMVLTRNPFTAGLLISNVAGLVMLVVLYRLVAEDFDRERAFRTVLYLSVFPTAFFFAAAYNESLFLCLSLLSFYHMRRGHWLLAGLFGFFASLTRSAGLLLLFPFCYEYLRQHNFYFGLGRHLFQSAPTTVAGQPQGARAILRWGVLRVDILAGLLIPAGIGVFALYCYIRFHDPLAFFHAQSHWQHRLAFPWHGILGSIRAIRISQGLLSFQALRNMLDLVPDLVFPTVILLSFIGPWKFPKSHWAYGFYAAVLYFFLQLFPVGGIFPLLSVARFLLEIFPVFIVLASIGKNRTFHLSYLMVSGAILFFLLTQFLTGHWII